MVHMYLGVGENVASRYFALKKVFVTLGHLREKVSKISEN